MFTDIHWGCRNNSDQHNQDCTEYVDWFISQVKKNKCNTIIFMGDWFENRNAINVATLNASYDALDKLNKLELPIYFLVGNHDLYHRNDRVQFSTYHYTQFSNVILTYEPLIDRLDNEKCIFFPYLFDTEYPNAAAMIKTHKPKYVFGHFEFKNFVVTGSDRMMEHGPDHKVFKGPTYIFSGHYHKRQANDNIIYIGNTFPTNFGDAWDENRGMAILDTKTEDVDFINWEDCPTFRKVKLSDVLNDSTLQFPPKCRVQCIIDTDITYSDAQSFKDEMLKAGNFREFSLEEDSVDKKNAIHGEETIDDLDLSLLNDAVITMLKTGVTRTVTIEPDILVEIYETL